MKTASRIVYRMAGWLTLLAMAALLSGCAHTSEPENASSRPWNSPKGWESGLPLGLTEGR